MQHEPKVRLIYRSRALQPWYTSADLDILNAALKMNPTRNVTGFLLREDDTYVQVLEGIPLDVDFLFDRISGDRRHRRVQVLQRKAAAQRIFGGWSMGYTHSRDGSMARRLRCEAKELTEEYVPGIIGHLVEISLRQTAVNDAELSASA